MLRLWSARHKFNTWRRVWLAVAEAQHEVGLPVTREQVEELRAVVERPGGITDDEIRAAERYERELRHDVMAHVHALGESCPKAKGIIHLGMTSQDVVCNADLLIIEQAMSLTQRKAADAFTAIGVRAEEYARSPSLGFTHYQAAQPVTVGRRLAQWAYELHLVWFRLFTNYETVKLKGLRGATGTQASFLALAGNRIEIVDRLEAGVISRLTGSLGPEFLQGLGDGPLGPRVPPALEGLVDESVMQALRAQTNALGTASGWLPGHTYSLVTQNYPRVFDTFVLSDLASVASVGQLAARCDGARLGDRVVSHRCGLGRVV